MVINWSEKLKQKDIQLGDEKDFDFQPFLSDYDINVLKIQKEVKLRVVVYSFILEDLTEITKVKKLARYLKDLYNFKLVYPNNFHFGFEVPRQKSGNIFLTNIQQSGTQTFKSYFGIDVENNVASIDLAKQPHTLLAGATGSGKSVCLNTIICSFLLGNSPDYLRFIFVDSKKTELNRYKKIKHCEAFIDDAKEVASMLKSAYTLIKLRNEEMEKNNLLDYNIMLGCRYVIVVDELADLISDPKYHDIIEYYLIKISQIGRSAGVHLILATQHPVVKVVNGSIKANLTTKICLQTTSSRDSVSVLGHKGGEQLLGKGDCLFKAPFSVGEKRVQIASVMPENIDKIIEVWKK